MPTVDFKPIANDALANVVTQAEYNALLGPLGALEHGYEAGTAKSIQVNKTLRQSSMVSAAVATFIANTLNQDVLDDGNLANLTAALTAAIQSLAWKTGQVMLTIQTVPDAGWVMCNDGTIGNAASGGSTRANADTQALFTLLWNNVSNTYAPVSSGRGASAAADFAANKTIALTKVMGRALAIAGAGSGLTARALGQTLGVETVALTEAQNGPHNHSVVDPGHGHGVNDPGHDHDKNTGVSTASGGVNTGIITPGGGNRTGSSTTGITVNNAATGITVGNSGTGAAHDNMQPTSFLNAMIKL